MKILMVSRTPTHPTNAGNRWGILTMSNTLQQLGCEIYFLYIDERGLRHFRKADGQKDFYETKSFWKDHFFVYRVGKLQKFYRNLLKKIRTFFMDYHQGLYDEYPLWLHKKINKLDTIYHFDICIVNYIFMTKAFRYIQIPRKVCFTHDVFAYKNLVVGEKCLWMDAAQEAHALQLCTDIFAVQNNEMHYFRVLSPLSNIYTIYSKYDYTPQPLVGNKNILFLSGDNSFNQNGLFWFLEKVFPKIRNQHKDSKLIIGGSICGVICERVKCIDGIELLGRIENPAEFYQLGDVAINPTYQGTGIKIKTFEAISYDKVTMVHPHSTNGIYKRSVPSLFASDNPEEWVSFLNKIWNDSSMIESIKRNNKEYMDAMNHFILSEYQRFLSPN